MALVCLIGAIAIYKPAFLAGYNIYIVSRQTAYMGLAALGVFFVILTGGIDLSLSSTVSLGGFTAGLAMVAGVHPALALVIGLLTGAVVGAVSGAVVAFIGVTPFIVTLGMLGITRSTVLLIKHGDSVRGIPASFIKFGNGDVAGFSVPVIVLIVVAALAHILTRHTAFGRRVYAIGGNEEATALSGVNTRRVKFFTYVICSSLCAVTGMLYISRFNSAQADAGKGLELDPIAAAVIGGTSLMGGEGSVFGVLVGAAIMGVIRNGLVFLGVSPYLQDLIIGAIIILAAILDVIRSRRHRRT